MHVDTTGPEGAPVLVLQHGFAGSARNWRPQQRGLRDQPVRVVAFDARGHARTAQRFSPARYALADFVRDFDDVARVASPDTPVVAGGLSLGAAVALHFALAHPERVRGLVVAAIPPGEARGFSGEADAFAELLEREGLEAAGTRFVWGPNSGLDPQAAQWVRKGFLEHPAPALAAILRQTLASLPGIEALRPRLAGLEVPTLVVVGEQDRGSLEACRTLAGALPQAQLCEIPDAGHVVNLAQPAAFNAALQEFLASLAVPVTEPAPSPAS